MPEPYDDLKAVSIDPADIEDEETSQILEAVPDIEQLTSHHLYRTMGMHLTDATKSCVGSPCVNCGNGIKYDSKSFRRSSTDEFPNLYAELVDSMKGSKTLYVHELQYDGYYKNEFSRTGSTAAYDVVVFDRPTQEYYEP